MTVYDSTRERAEAERGANEYVVPVSSVDHGQRIRAVGWGVAIGVAGVEPTGEFVKVLWEWSREAPEPYTIFHQDEWVLSETNSALVSRGNV